jgi:hypothetical protein
MQLYDEVDDDAIVASARARHRVHTAVVLLVFVSAARSKARYSSIEIVRAGSCGHFTSPECRFVRVVWNHARSR